MKSLISLAVVGGVVLPAATPALDYTIAPVSAARVEIHDAFWAPKIEANRTVSIQHVSRK